jgi:Fur family ferric uptake transcriptional regulator
VYSVIENTFHLQLEMRLSERKVTATLRRHGYKLTPQRLAVVQAITSSQDSLTPATIYGKVQPAYPNIGLVTVYRTLEILAELGLICELHGGGICRSYTTSLPEHHHHLICSGCGTVVDFTQHHLGGLESSLSKQSGFRIDGHLLEFFGLCPACQVKKEGFIG